MTYSIFQYNSFKIAMGTQQLDMKQIDSYEDRGGH